MPKRDAAEIASVGRKKQKKESKLTELEAKIKALENDLSDSDESSSDSETNSGDDSDLIPALNPALLPENNIRGKVGQAFSRQLNHSERGKQFWKERLDDALKAYVPSQNRPLYCRICQQDFTDKEDLFDHRKTDSHKMAEKVERELTYCRLCAKQFTSVQQLKNHQEGKLHRAKQDRRPSELHRGRPLQRGVYRRGGHRGRGRGGGRGRVERSRGPLMT